MSNATGEFSLVEDSKENETRKSKSSSRQKICVALVIFLLLAGIACALYFVLRLQPEKTPVVNNRAERILPCPKYPKLTGDYNSESCGAQPNCKWIDFDLSLKIPYNCTYDTSESAPWTLSQLNSNNSWKSFSLVKGSQDLRLDLFCRSKNELRLKVTDPKTSRYEVPSEALPIADVSTSCELAKYSFVVSEKDRTFKLVSNRVTIAAIPFDGGFVFDKQFLQVTLRLNSSTNYGFGEHNHKELKLDMNYKTWSIYTRDVAPVDEWNLYGAQPYFMSLSSKHSFVLGTLLKNSNAMDVHLQPDPYPAVTYRVVGGILDFHFFVDKSPEAVTQHYTLLTGRPLLPPYWSLGFQLSRWGYQNTTHVREVVERNQRAGIPLDVVYGDIDYMSDKLIFTLDKDNFLDLPDFVEEIRTNQNLHYVIILDPGIGREPDSIQKLDGGKYKALDDGLAEDIFVKEANGTNLVGEVWPGEVYFPDFTNPKTTEWWKSQIWDFYNNLRNVNDSGLKFDGLWVDMNEPANFRDGKEAERVCTMTNELNSPPYIPENLLGNSLVDKTICMDARQDWGTLYNVHSLYGHSMAQSTYRSLRELFPDERPFVLTRSTFAGTSQYAIHWLGDNQSQWRQVPWSIISMLEYSLFGFSMTGADICGFWYNTTETLCQRWMQLGAFYPYARNHNAGYNGDENFLHLDQDPANFGEAMIKSSRDVLLTRYKLLPYLYTLMYLAHTTGSTVARPLFFEFMADTETHTVDRQFLWGPALMISPCMEENSVEVEAYFPAGRWYNYFTGLEVVSSQTWTKLHTPLDKINLHVRGGYVIPWQEPDVNTALSKSNPYGLLVALSEDGEAEGELYLDDGSSADPTLSGNYSLVRFSVSLNKITIQTVKSGYTTALQLPLATIQVFGVSRRPNMVNIDSHTVNNFTMSYMEYSKTLTFKIQDKKFTFSSNHTVSWSSI